MNLCLFDLDHTLLPLDSDHEFGEFLIRQGLADGVEYRRRNDGFYQQYCDGTLVLGDYIQFTTSIWRQLDAGAQLALQQAFMDDVIFPAMKPQAVELVEKHRALGDLIAIVTATNEFVTRPIAAVFDVPELLAVKLGIGGGPCWPPEIHALNPSIKVGTMAVIVAPSCCCTCSWTISGIRATCALSS